MKKIFKKVIIFLLALNLLFPEITPVSAETGQPADKAANPSADIAINSKAAVVLEGSSGKILFEKNKDDELMIASVTKVMTLLLIFDAIKSGQIKPDDNVSVSEYAASMGGSQVYLEPGETQTVDTMIKCISISSANDAAVAMAEHICGTEEAFVAKMNEKAASLGMKHTHFINCNGLDDDITSGHYSSAYDVAVMSKELIMNYPEVSKYSTVWMDTFIHTNRKGEEKEFGLTNTNKLIRSYDGITGLKTGSTSKAGYCLSATAKRDDINIISVVLSAPDPKTRFGEAAKLLDLGFSKCKRYFDKCTELNFQPVKVNKSLTDEITYAPANDFSCIFTENEDISLIEKKVILNEDITAPVNVGDKIGKINYLYDGKVIGEVPLVSKKAAEAAALFDYYKYLLFNYISLRYFL